MAVVGSLSPHPLHTSIVKARQNTWAVLDDPASFRNKPARNRHHMLGRTSLSSEFDGFELKGVDALTAFNTLDAIELPLMGAGNSPQQLRKADDSLAGPQTKDSYTTGTISKGSFRRFVQSIHRRRSQRPTILRNEASPTWKLQDLKGKDFDSPSSIDHQQSSSGSLGFVSAVRSASLSFASNSTEAQSRRNNTRSRGRFKTAPSSMASLSGLRTSEDSTMLERAASLDLPALHRALQRRRVLEELVNTEESYIGDIRLLMNVYVTYLASLPAFDTALRLSINHNLNAIIQLHEEFLGELHRVIPHSEYTQPNFHRLLSRTTNHGLGHRRWWSHDVAQGDKNEIARLHAEPGMVIEPQVAAEVARVFSKLMNRFFIYQEYGAKYETMIRDITGANENMSDWERNQRGIEAIATAVGSFKHRDSKLKKALTSGDLLVKPVQRVCKYPLLFAELLKYTPVSECPNSHMEIEITLMRIREATAEINKATSDACIKATLEKTWLLQDRLMFANRTLDATSRNQIRSFGHIQLCGVLHICWQSNDTVQGQYMICLLYRDMLVLASAGRVEPVYTIQASINLNNARVDEAENGRGMQCHTAPFSWKLEFECDHQLYEIIMTGCTLREEEEWRPRLCRPFKQNYKMTDSNLYSSIALDMKSLGTVFGKPGTMAREHSIDRATTVGPKSPLCRVILRKTSLSRNNPSPAVTIHRSHSLLTNPQRIPVLAPARSERSRLELLLTDVWTRDVLPFPGMTSTRARSEQRVRSSASSVMRKLSVASLGNSFGKKSESFTPMTRSDEERTSAGVAAKTESKQPDAVHIYAEAVELTATGPASTSGYQAHLQENSLDTGLPRSASISRLKHTGSFETVHRPVVMDPVSDTKTYEEVLGQENSSLRNSSTNSFRRSSSTMSVKLRKLCTRQDNVYQAPSAKPWNHRQWTKVGKLFR